MTVNYSSAVHNYSPDAVPFEYLQQKRSKASPEEELTDIINKARKAKGKESLQIHQVKNHIDSQGGSFWSSFVKGAQDVSSIALPLITTLAPLL